MTALLVALGAMVGAPLRYLTDTSVQSRHDSVLPWGTLTVNVAGSLVFGLLVGGAAAGGVAPAVLSAAGVGFCGALTTYSTFGLETVQLTKGGAPLHALLNIVLSLAAGLTSAWLGLAAADLLWV